MLDHNAAFHIKRIDELGKTTETLRDRMELDFSVYRGDKFKMNKDEGKWDEVTTNRYTTEGNKIVDYLTYARRKLWIPISDEKEKKRKDLSATERLAIGVLGLADDIIANDPLSAPIQAQACFYAPVRGWRAYFLYLREEDDSLIPEIMVWDPLNVRWISGRKGMIYVSNIRYDDKESIKDEYKGWNGEVDDKGKAKVVFVCDKDEMGTIIGDEWVVDPKSHGLDYIPARIKFCRSTPLIQSERYPDTIKNVGESFMANNRNLAAIESRLMTYQLTRAGILAKTPLFTTYDSTKGGKPIDFEGAPNSKGAVVSLDEGKGESILPGNFVSQGSQVETTANSILGMTSMGGLSPIAYGQINQALPAQGIDILAHQALDVIKPFKQAVESDFVWMAEEIVRQYKTGDFGELHLEGYDHSNNRFRTDITPDQIDENWRFECELIPDLIRDDQMGMNMATMAVKSGLLSPQTARDKYHLVDDTDLEEEKLSRNRAKMVAEIDLWEMAVALAQDGDKLGANIILRKLRELAGQPMEQGQGGTQGAGQGPMGGANISNQPQVPSDIQQKAAMMRNSNA